ncbi:hypothetical protein OHB41_43095 [Streptomyces sp. NBC_01571]|uniref:hypothetical protein n=1 Tax=Streptomyces sp. NBC_01571 TaxID=2975883 RepID=UPI00225A6161|nr:hypothetical protein [Streptomyces sp. NBC_01571]MCX4579845.1 hypothetical protein [Streptomyces sp. NBC_01571]
MKSWPPRAPTTARCGSRLRPFDGRVLADNITRDWGQFVAYPTRKEWRLRSVPKDTPGALPLTWMYASDAHTQGIGNPVRCPACRHPSRGLDYARKTGQRVHLCPAPVCGHRWTVDDSPTSSDSAATGHDQRAALTAH